MNKALLAICLMVGILATQVTIPTGSYNTLIPFKKNQASYNATNKISSFSVQMAMYYSWFASYAYCLDGDVSSGACCRSVIETGNNWQLISHSFALGPLALENNNNYVIFRSDIYKKFVIGFPGTRGGISQLFDEVTNSGLVTVNGSVKVMEYVRDLVERIKGIVFSNANLNLLRAHKDYQIILTGHSLGGATAALIAYYSLYYTSYSFQNSNRLVILTYGQNRVGNQNFVSYLESKADIYRVIKKNDIVPLIPFCKTSGDICVKTDDKPLHAGKYYLINADRTKITYCLEEYKALNDTNCENKKSLASLDFDNHNIYFGDQKFSQRCK